MYTLSIEHVDRATRIENFFFLQIPSVNSAPEYCNVILL